MEFILDNINPYMVFFWMLGYFYALGVLDYVRESVRDELIKNKEIEEGDDIETSFMFKILLLFTWPHYIGYTK